MPGGGASDARKVVMKAQRTTVCLLTSLLSWSQLVPVALAAVPECFGKSATIVGTEFADDLEGTSGNDVIVGRGGVDNIYGHGGDDLICSGPGARAEEQLLIGGAGDDKLKSGRHGDALYGDGHGDGLSHPKGHDVLLGKGSRDYINGGPLQDRLRGGKGNDARLNGEGGDDRVSGGRGDDAIHGEAGDDVLLGGRGKDDLLFTESCCDYSYDSGSVVVNLARGTAVAADGTDSLGYFEVVIGSQAGDILKGGKRSDHLNGNLGSDTAWTSWQRPPIRL